MRDESGTGRLLVVDDDPAVLTVASRILSRAGYDVSSAEGSAAALELAEEEGSFDLLLTDVVMPGMNGRELAEAFHERWPETPVLYMSAYTEDEVIREGIRLNSVTLLSKPFSVEEIVGAVESALARTD